MRSHRSAQFASKNMNKQRVKRPQMPSLLGHLRTFDERPNGGKRMSIFTKAGVAIITPFKEDDLSVNYDAFAELIDFQIDNGTDCIIVCGSTGEAATMTEQEHLDVHRLYQKARTCHRRKRLQLHADRDQPLQRDRRLRRRRTSGHPPLL